MTLTFDLMLYNNLLVEVTPKVIESEYEYEQMLATVEALTFQRDRTPEQTALYKLLVMLIESYEEDHYPIPAVSPNAILQHIMEASGTTQEDLVGILGSDDTVTDILSGQQPMSPVQAHILAEQFKVSPSLFV